MIIGAARGPPRGFPTQLRHDSLSQEAVSQISLFFRFAGQVHGRVLGALVAFTPKDKIHKEVMGKCAMDTSGEETENKGPIIVSNTVMPIY